MGLKNGGLRGSLRNIGTGVGIPDSVVDSFEDGDISEYGVDTGKFGVSSNWSYDGSNALLSTADFGELVSTSGLPVYPQAGGRTFVYFNIDGAGNRAAKFHFGAQSQGNPVTTNAKMYSVFVDGVNDELEVTTNNFATNKSDAVSTTIPRSVPIRAELEWHTAGNDEIRVSAYNDDTSDQIGSEVSITDATYTSGGIGFGLYGGTNIDTYWDYAVTDS